MKVVIFGAGGGTGRELVSQALRKEYSVTAFVHSPGKFEMKHPKLTIRQGDVADYEAVAGAVVNQDAVVCVLGSGNSLKRHPELIDGVRNIIKGMEREGVRRLIYQSVLGVGSSIRQLGLLDKYFIVPFVIYNVVADHTIKESFIKQSELDWVIIRPPRLTNGQRTGVYRSGEHIKAKFISSSISRGDVADFILKQLSDDTYLCKTPGIMY